MVLSGENSSRWIQRVVLLSLLLIFFTIPHILEDFATGEPIEKGIPVQLLALIISIIFSLQALGLFWIGQKKRRGLIVHLVLGLFWPIASGLAQLSAILSEPIYRSGVISIIYVVGIILVGILLFLSAIISLKNSS